MKDGDEVDGISNLLGLLASVFGGHGYDRVMADDV